LHLLNLLHLLLGLLLLARAAGAHLNPKGAHLVRLVGLLVCLLLLLHARLSARRKTSANARGCPLAALLDADHARLHRVPVLVHLQRPPHLRLLLSLSTTSISVSVSISISGLSWRGETQALGALQVVGLEELQLQLVGLDGLAFGPGELVGRVRG